MARFGLFFSVKMELGMRASWSFAPPWVATVTVAERRGKAYIQRGGTDTDRSAVSLHLPFKRVKQKMQKKQLESLFGLINHTAVLNDYTCFSSSLYFACSENHHIFCTFMKTSTKNGQCLLLHANVTDSILHWIDKSVLRAPSSLCVFFRMQTFEKSAPLFATSSCTSSNMKWS